MYLHSRPAHGSLFHELVVDFVVRNGAFEFVVSPILSPATPNVQLDASRDPYTRILLHLVHHFKHKGDSIVAPRLSNDRVDGCYVGECPSATDLEHFLVDVVSLLLLGFAPLVPVDQLLQGFHVLLLNELLFLLMRFHSVEVLAHAALDLLLSLHTVPVLYRRRVLRKEVLLDVLLLSLVADAKGDFHDLLPEVFVVLLLRLFDHRFQVGVVLLVLSELLQHCLLWGKFWLVDPRNRAISLLSLHLGDVGE